MLLFIKVCIQVLWLLLCGGHSIEVWSPSPRGIVVIYVEVTALPYLGAKDPLSRGLSVVDSSLYGDAVLGLVLIHREGRCVVGLVKDGSVLMQNVWSSQHLCFDYCSSDVPRIC